MLASVANAPLFLPLSVRVGRPGLLLRGLCLPAERADDEPLLPLWLLSQVIVLLLLRDRGGRALTPRLPFSFSQPVSLSASRSDSYLGGVVTTTCFFFNHGEVSVRPFDSNGGGKKSPD